MTLFRDTNDWRAGMQDVSAAIDDTMGELVTMTPVRSGGVNFAPIPEPEKAVTVIAVFTSQAKTVLKGTDQRYGGVSLSPLITTSEPVFSFAYAALPFAIGQGYRIKLHRTGEIFEAKDVRPDGVARIVVPVVQLGRQSESR